MLTQGTMSLLLRRIEFVHMTAFSDLASREGVSGRVAEEQKRDSCRALIFGGSMPFEHDTTFPLVRNEYSVISRATRIDVEH